MLRHGSFGSAPGSVNTRELRLRTLGQLNITKPPPSGGDPRLLMCNSRPLSIPKRRNCGKTTVLIKSAYMKAVDGESKRSGCNGCTIYSTQPTLTDKSLLSAVIPFRKRFVLSFANGARMTSGSKKYPIDRFVPQSKFTLPPRIMPGLYTTQVPNIVCWL